MKCHLYRIKQSLCLMAFLCSFQVYAQTEPAVMYVGPFAVTPKMEIVSESDDNAASAPKGAEAKEDILLVSPSFSAVADNGVVVYSLDYALENGDSSNANSDYIDQMLDAKISWSMNIRHLIELNASIEDSHQERSVDSVSGVAGDLNQFKDQGLGINYTFGSEGADGRIVIGYQHNKLRYDTNRDATAVLDTDTRIVNAELSIAVSPESRFIFQLEKTENTFLVDTQSNRQDMSYLLGFSWGLPDVLAAEVRVGETKNDLVNVPGNASMSATGSASIEWKPTMLSTWTLSANQSTQNSENNVGTFTNALEYVLGWEYRWRDNINTTFSFSTVKDEFIGAGREDNTNQLSLGVKYTVRRWLSFSLGYQYEERDSNDDSVDFDKNILNLSVSASL